MQKEGKLIWSIREEGYQGKKAHKTGTFSRHILQEHIARTYKVTTSHRSKDKDIKGCQAEQQRQVPIVIAVRPCYSLLAYYSFLVLVRLWYMLNYVYF